MRSSRIISTLAGSSRPLSTSVARSASLNFQPVFSASQAAPSVNYSANPYSTDAAFANAIGASTVLGFFANSAASENTNSQNHSLFTTDTANIAAVKKHNAEHISALSAASPEAGSAKASASSNAKHSHNRFKSHAVTFSARSLEERRHAAGLIEPAPARTTQLRS